MRRSPANSFHVLFLLLGACLSIGIGLVFSGVVSSHTKTELLLGATPTPSPACTPGWAAGPDWNPPTGGVRAVGVYFPTMDAFMPWAADRQIRWQ
jgi:hypothetical protein